MIEAKPDILEVMVREGIELERGKAPCPFHDEKTPSFIVNPKRQTFHCFGCGVHGDSIDFVMKRHSVNFKEALDILGISNGKPAPPDPAIQRRKKLLQEFKAWKTDFYFRLCDELLSLKKTKELIQKFPRINEEMAGVFAQNMGRLAVTDYKLNLLAEGNQETLFSLYCEDLQNG